MDGNVEQPENLGRRVQSSFQSNFRVGKPGHWGLGILLGAGRVWVLRKSTWADLCLLFSAFPPRHTEFWLISFQMTP
jgi:hypothetical protein